MNKIIGHNLRKIVAILLFLFLFSLMLLPQPFLYAAEEKTDPILGKKDKGADFSELYKMIEDERKSLEKKKTELEEHEKRLKALQAEISKDYKKLNSAAKALELKVNDMDEKRIQKMRGIVKLYESMGPEEAAKALEKLDTKFAAQLISLMNSRKSGKILDSMDSNKVKEITKEMNR